MVQSIAAKDVTLRELKQNFGIQIVQDATFFPEWLDGLEALNKEEQHLLDRVIAAKDMKKLMLFIKKLLNAICEVLYPLQLPKL